MALKTDYLGIEKSNENTMLTFLLGKQIFALPINQVRQIIEMVTITTLPQYKDFVKGIINFHGTVVPVVNMRLFLQMPEIELGMHTPLILVHQQNWLLGLIVDEVLDVLTLNPDQILVPKKIFPESFGEAPMLKGMIHEKKATIMLLDIDLLFKSQQVQSITSKKQPTRPRTHKDPGLKAEEKPLEMQK